MLYDQVRTEERRNKVNRNRKSLGANKHNKMEKIEMQDTEVLVLVLVCYFTV